MKKINIYIGLLLFLGFVLGCSEDKIVLTGQGNLTGKVVTSGANLPIENVKISTSPSTSTVFTNSSGVFSLASLAVGDYSVQAQKDGFITAFEGVIIVDDGSTNVIFELDIETANNDAPTAATLISPANNTIDTEIEVTLNWSATDPEGDAVVYTVEILNDQNSNSLQFTDLTDSSLTVSNLEYGTKYFWQVSASDNINDPVWSTVFNFETLGHPNNRVLFTRQINGNNVIFSADEMGNEFQLTSVSSNSWRPRKASAIDKIAFFGSNGGQTHLYTMNLDGSDMFQVTNAIAVTGFDLEELDFAWMNNDTRLLYPNFDKLYKIDPSGASLELVHQTTNGNFISEIDWNQNTSRIALKTNNGSGYAVEIYTINTSGLIQTMVQQAMSGASGGLDFSFDGNLLLYSRDITGNENTEYRQLNSNLFVYDFIALTTTNVSLDKPAGTNDLDPRFSPNEAKLIFVNTSNDGVSQNNIVIQDLGASNSRVSLIADGKMPDWK